MPAKSKAQQRFFGMVRSAQKGEMDNPSSEVLDAADSISVEDAKKFAKTKHKGLPEKKGVNEASVALDANTKIKNKEDRKKKEKEYAKLMSILAHRKKMKEMGLGEEVVTERLGGKGYKPRKDYAGRTVSGDWEDSDRGSGNKATRRAGGEVEAKSPTYLAHIKNKKKKQEVSEARANAVIARRILQNKKKCADCGSYAHVTGASNCPSKKDPEGLPEGASILKARGKRNTYRGPTGDHRRDKEGNIEADFYKKKPAPTGEKWGNKSGRPKKPSPLEVRARRKKRKEEKAAKAAGSAVQTKSGKKTLDKNSNYEKLKAEIYAKDDARKKKAQEYSKKTNPNYGKSHGGRKYEYTSVKEGKLDNVMNIVRKYGKKKPEKKAEKAMDAGARAKRLLQRKQHAKYVSGSTENVPDDIRDHYTHI